MIVRIIACLIVISFGSLALYIVGTKPKHPWSEEPADQALGVPRIITRIIRGGFGLLFVILSIIGILRTLKVLSE